MKILEAGNPQGTWTENITCTARGNGGNGCGAKLELEPSDVFWTKTYSMGRECGTYFTIECACCKAWNDLTDEVFQSIPSGLKSKIFASPQRKS